MFLREYVLSRSNDPLLTTNSMKLMEFKVDVCDEHDGSEM